MRVLHAYVNLFVHSGNLKLHTMTRTGEKPHGLISEDIWDLFSQMWA